MREKRIYLDYAASTPTDPRVVETMLRYLGPDAEFGNPSSSTHDFGWAAKEAIEVARRRVSSSIGASPREITFTSGATESNCLALLGVAEAHRGRGLHIVTSATEHKSVLNTCGALERRGYELTVVRVDGDGLVSPDELAAALREDTILVSIMQVNNETGVVQDLAPLAEMAHLRGALFHSDAAQSLGKVSIDVSSQRLDLVSLSAHKAYGPKGVGALYVRRHPRVGITPLFFGGDQERGLRPGTLATHQIVGMGKAFALAEEEREADCSRLSVLRDSLWQKLEALGGVYLNGSVEHRVASTLNVSIEGIDGRELAASLGPIAAASGSACNSSSVEPSHVLTALGRSESLAESSLRLTLGRFTTEEEIDQAGEVISRCVRRLRAGVQASLTDASVPSNPEEVQGASGEEAICFVAGRPRRRCG